MRTFVVLFGGQALGETILPWNEWAWWMMFVWILLVFGAAFADVLEILDH